MITFTMPNKQKNIKRPWVAERVDYSRRTTTNTGFYNSWPWRKLRKRFIETNPNCKKCEDEGIVNEGKYVDHI